MKYEIIDAPVTNGAGRKYERVDQLGVGQALRIPLSELSTTAQDPASAVRSTGYYWGRRLGWRFRTRIVGGDILLVRTE